MEERKLRRISPVSKMNWRAIIILAWFFKVVGVSCLINNIYEYYSWTIPVTYVLIIVHATEYYIKWQIEPHEPAII